MCHVVELSPSSGHRARDSHQQNTVFKDSFGYMNESTTFDSIVFKYNKHDSSRLIVLPMQKLGKFEHYWNIAPQ